MRILIATDGSLACQLVHDEVVGRPWPLGTELRLLRVVAAPRYPVPPSIAQKAMFKASAELEATAEHLRARTAHRVSAMVTEGNPAEAIVEMSELWESDFVFLGSRGLGRIGKFLLGSTVGTVLQEAPCAVDVVRRVAPDEANSRSRPGMKILLATDGADCSDAAVESVAARPWPAGSEIRVVSVPVYAGPRMETSYLDAEMWDSVRSNAVREANQAVETALARLARSGLKAEGSVPAGLAGPRACILAEAARWTPDLIVVGSHSRNRLDRFLLGSVSRGLALHAPCSVEVFREKSICETKEDFGNEMGVLDSAVSIH